MKRLLIPITIMTVAALMAAPQVAAQDGVVDTSYTLDPDKFAGQNEPGDETFGFVALTIKCGQGGFNPNQETWTFTLEPPADAPEGIEFRLPSDAAFTFTPPAGPTADDTACDGKGPAVNWQIDAVVTEDAELDMVHTVTFPVTVDAPPVGTYKSPSGPESVDLTIETVSPDDGPIPGAGGDDGNETDDPGTAGGADTEEGPMPMPPLFAMITLLAFALLRRRD